MEKKATEIDMATEMSKGDLFLMHMYTHIHTCTCIYNNIIVLYAQSHYTTSLCPTQVQRLPKKAGQGKKNKGPDSSKRRRVKANTKLLEKKTKEGT